MAMSKYAPLFRTTSLILRQKHQKSTWQDSLRTLLSRDKNSLFVVEKNFDNTKKNLPKTGEEHQTDDKEKKQLSRFKFYASIFLTSTIALGSFYLLKWQIKSLLAKEDFRGERSIVITPRQRLFFQFSSIEYEGIPYMTPQDFLESVTENHPRPRIHRKILSKSNYEQYIKNTPLRKYGSSKLFRNLEDRGLISYSEYLFLLCVITRPKTGFQIAFKMFDTDGNDQVDKKEFLVLEKVMNGKYETGANEDMVTKIFQRDSEPKEKHSGEALKQTNKLLDSLTIHANRDMLISKNDDFLNKSEVDATNHLETTLLVHFFGHRGNNVLKYEDFKKFMEDLQREVLEIEFNEFSKGMNRISPIEFAEILLRYTDFDQVKKRQHKQRLKSLPDAFKRNISFESFLQFSNFMNNLEDFGLALKFHTYANKAISEAEFQRAVKISSGFELDPQIVQVIFRIFDCDGDGHLSYKEFIAILKDRLRRGLKVHERQVYELNSSTNDLFEDANTDSQSDVIRINDEKPTFMKMFKACVRRKLKEKQLD